MDLTPPKYARVYDFLFKEDLETIVNKIVTEYVKYYKDDKDVEYIQLTVGTNGDLCEVTGSVEYGYQTGDNSYTGGAYGYSHWGVVEIDDESDTEEVADSLIEQLSELLAYEDLDC